MAVAINLTPNVSTYTYGDPSIATSMSGGTAPSYLWESNSGVFSDKYAATPSFTPNNATKIVSIIGRFVYRSLSAGFAGSGSVGAYGINGGLTKTGGSSAAWDAQWGGVTVPVGATAFFEFTAVATNKEKAGGFFTNSLYRDPTTVHATNAVQLAWHLYGNGTAVPRKLGTALATTVVYKSGDVFRVSIEGSKAVFYLNGVAVATTSLPSGTLYPVALFKTVGSIIDNPSFLDNAAVNEGVTTLSVVGLLPVQPNYTYDVTEDNNTLVSVAEDGTSTFRIKSKAKKSLNLQFIERPFSEYQQLADFWRAHQRHEKFFYLDVIYNDIYLMRFDSPLRTAVQAPDSITIQLTLKEV